jgi:hypothetical protein
MRKHNIARGLVGRIAIVAAVVTVAACAARASAALPVEAGYPTDLINTPVCAVVESFEDPRNCRTTERPEGTSRAFHWSLR